MQCYRVRLSQIIAGLNASQITSESVAEHSVNPEQNENKEGERSGRHRMSESLRSTAGPEEMRACGALPRSAF